MNYFHFALISILTISCKPQVSCDIYQNENYIPIDLDDSFNYLNCNLSEVELKSFKEQDEKEAISQLHFSTGLYIRNNWGLWSGESELFKFFENLGVTHPDDISGIILTSYHRSINGKNTQFDKMISEAKKYWEQIESEKLAAINLKYKNIRILDTVEFQYPYGFIENSKNHNFEEQSCYALGVVTNKEPNKLQLKVKLIENCDEAGIVISEKYFDLKDSIEFKEIINRPDIVVEMDEEYWSNLKFWDEY